MISLGQISDRQILYINLRTTSDLNSEFIADSEWIAFTIADNEDRDLVDEVVELCLDKHVGYTCSTGDLAYYVELCFDQEYVNRAITYEDNTGKEYDYNNHPLPTTAGSNFGEMFWFAATTAFCDP